MIFNQCISLAQITRRLLADAPWSEKTPRRSMRIWIDGHNIFDQFMPINARPPVELGEELTSQHPGGVNALFGDGSVQFLKNSMNVLTLTAICTRASGEVVYASSY